MWVQDTGHCQIRKLQQGQCEIWELQQGQCLLQELLLPGECSNRELQQGHSNVDFSWSWTFARVEVQEHPYSESLRPEQEHGLLKLSYEDDWFNTWGSKKHISAIPSAGVANIEKIGSGRSASTSVGTLKTTLCPLTGKPHYIKNRNQPSLWLKCWNKFSLQAKNETFDFFQKFKHVIRKSENYKGRSSKIK